MELFELSLDCILKHLMSHSHLGKNECSFNSHRKDNLDISQGMESTGVPQTRNTAYLRTTYFRLYIQTKRTV